MKTTNAQNFTKRTWDAFAGAERFKDGSDPIIASADVSAVDGTEDRTLIISGSGIEVCFVQYDLESDEVLETVYHAEVIFTNDKLALVFAKHFPLDDLNLADELFNEFGFEQIV